MTQSKFEKLEYLLAQRADLQRRLAKVQSEINTAVTEAENLIQKAKGGEEVPAIIPFVTSKMWRCAETDDFCRYNQLLDPCHDGCVNCGEPEERK